MVFGTGLQGGVFQDLRVRWSTTSFPYLSHSAVVIPYESARLCRTGKKEGDESDPPQKWGAMRTRIAALSSSALSGPMGVALVLIYPCGKAWKQPPRRGAERRETDL